MNKKFIVYGFGRMGLTHFAILNQLVDNADFVFVDPDKRVNYFARKNINSRIISNDKVLDEQFDFALICTPPMFHIPILHNCINKSIPNIFVEKPFGGVNDDYSSLLNLNHSISIGYVLRFNPIVQWIKENIEVENIAKVEGYYFSNTIEKKPKGWRNGLYSGVINEVGAHILDLSVYLFGLSNPLVINKKINSVISDVDDIVTADLEDKNIKYHFHFDWVNKGYRKPVFNFVITMVDGTIIRFDQQKIEINSNSKLKRISTVDLSTQVPYYLRGVDFTSQMQDFVGSKSTIASLQDSLITRTLIKKLISK